MGFEQYFNVFQMGSDIMFGLKVVALVMLYGYMHMNLGGGMVSTVLFAIFGYYLLFYAQGMLAIIVLVLFFLTIHGFDIIWGGDIAKGQFAERAAVKQAAMPQMHAPPMYHMRPPPP